MEGTQERCIFVLMGSMTFKCMEYLTDQIGEYLAEGSRAYVSAAGAVKLPYESISYTQQQ